MQGWPEGYLKLWREQEGGRDRGEGGSALAGTKVIMGFPGGAHGKEPAANAGDVGLIPGSGRSPGGGHGSPLQYSCLENPHGQRSLAGYSPWGHKESEMTKAT